MADGRLPNDLTHPLFFFYKYSADMISRMEELLSSYLRSVKTQIIPLADTLYQLEEKVKERRCLGGWKGFFLVKNTLASCLDCGFRHPRHPSMHQYSWHLISQIGTNTIRMRKFTLKLHVSSLEKYRKMWPFVYEHYVKKHFLIPD